MVIDLQLLSLLLRFLSPFVIGLFAWYMWTLDQRLTPRKEYENNRKKDKEEFYSFKKEYLEKQQEQDIVRAENSKDIKFIKENITEMKSDLKEAIRKKNN